MKKDYQIAHAWGKHCKKCKKILSFELGICPICGGGVVMVMSAFQVPRGCIFVYDDGEIPGGNEWVEQSEDQYRSWNAAVSRRRPGT